MRSGRATRWHSFRLWPEDREAIVVVFKFEDIGDELKLLPLAARRALDLAGCKVSLHAWQSMPLRARRVLVEQGSGDEVDLQAVHSAVAGCEPPSVAIKKREEDRSELPDKLLLDQLPRLGDRWEPLGFLQRFALQHLAKRGDAERLARAWREIAGPLLSHLDEQGTARMVAIASKKTTARHAVAAARVRMTPATAAMVLDNSGPKGDVLSTARLAAIMATKRTPDLIPMCHSIAVTGVDVGIDVNVAQGTVDLRVRVEAVDRTGVEMEAMTAASVGALTIYDMLKAVQRSIRIEDVHLLEKSGGRSGDYRAGDATP